MGGKERNPKPRRRRRWLRRIGITAVVLVALYTVGGFFGVPLFIRYLVVPSYSRGIAGTVTVNRVTFNPFTYTVGLEGLEAVGEDGGPVAGFAGFTGNFQLFRSVFGRGYCFRSAILTDPSLQGVFHEDGTINLVEAFSGENRTPLRELPRLAIDELKISGGRANLRDVHLAEPFELTLQDLSFAVEDFDTRPEHQNEHRMHGTTASGARIEWTGSALLKQSFRLWGTIRITGFPVPQGMPYAVDYTEARIVGGTLDAEVSYELSLLEQPPVARVTLDEARISALAVEQNDEPLLDIDEIAVTGARADLEARTLTVSDISTRGTHLRVERGPEGDLSVAGIMKSRAASPAPVLAAALAAPAEGPEAVETALRQVVATTRSLIERARLPWTIDIGRIGVADYTAEVTDQSLTTPAEATVAVQSVDVAGIAFAAGEGTARVESVTVTAPEIDAVAGLLPTESPESPQDEAETEAVAGAEAVADATAATPLALTIGTVAVKSGAMRIRDERTDPPALVELDDLDFEATDVRTVGDTAVPFTLSSNLQGTGQLEVTGRVDLLRAYPVAELQITVDGLPLKPYDPLARPYAGYGVETGRLALSFPVTAKEGHVDGDLSFTFDGLRLGRKVKSPYAPDAPIKLGLDLLRDKNDRIEGTIPVSGDMTDPGFSVSNLVWDAFMGLIVKAATSPFDLLGSIFAGDDEVDISRVEFEPASAELSADALTALDVLARAIVERPALRLEVIGRWSPEADDAPTRMILLREQILARIRERTTLIEELTDEAYATWVAHLYERDIGPARDEAGEPLPQKTMEAAVLAGITVPEKRKEALARARVEAVVSVLVKDNGVPEDRITQTIPDGEDLVADTPRVDFALGGSSSGRE